MMVWYTVYWLIGKLSEVESSKRCDDALRCLRCAARIGTGGHTYPHNRSLKAEVERPSTAIARHVFQRTLPCSTCMVLILQGQEMRVISPSLIKGRNPFLRRLIRSQKSKARQG